LPSSSYTSYPPSYHIAQPLSFRPLPSPQSLHISHHLNPSSSSPSLTRSTPLSFASTTLYSFSSIHNFAASHPISLNLIMNIDIIVTHTHTHKHTHTHTLTLTHTDTHAHTDGSVDSQQVSSILISTLPLIPSDASCTALGYDQCILTILPSSTILHLLLPCLNVSFSIPRSFLSNSHAPPNHTLCIACVRESAPRCTECPSCILCLIFPPIFLTLSHFPSPVCVTATSGPLLSRWPPHTCHLSLQRSASVHAYDACNAYTAAHARMHTHRPVWYTCRQEKKRK
jgi:hypothetical protein